MKDFTNQQAIAKLDPQDTLGSTELLPKQLEKVWGEVQKLDLSLDADRVSNIVFCGMGASIYGALVLKAILGEKFAFPVEIISDYHLPLFVDSSSLVVLTSYSGSTEEVLSCAQEAKAKKAQMLVLTKGGKLAQFAKENNVPAYIFDGELNPSGVPRLGNGYTILGLMGLLHKTGVVSLDVRLIDDAINMAHQIQESVKSKALKDANRFLGKVPIVFAAEHLSGNAQILRNQFNETSKTFCSFYLIPDLNHHLMEGLQFPKLTNLQFLVLNSPCYSKRIKKRVALTIDVVRQNNHTIDSFNTSGKSAYHDAIESMIYSGFLTLFLGLLYDQNPAVNPWVDYFKKKLSE
ncbi:MAG: hypothetical protein A2698_00870 [Candidatus Levybacteria bacterium RIFCSPHIGHO2_01_FULL_42_15]|nr:MAG: hypothetical protein A2698_00870 [Candidatus Levybacteria bacterium RIFCSPHIGHO2_01_FULL_42_15]